MKVSELVKLLKKNGCCLERHGKNHDIWYSEITGKKFSVPRHPSQDVPKGTFENIKEDAGFKPSKTSLLYKDSLFYRRLANE